MKFAFIAKHRGIWPVGWLCEALGVSRGGFYAWLTRPRSQRSRSDEELGAKVRASFVASDRTYGARRVWKDMLAEGLSCGLHRTTRVLPVRSPAFALRIKRVTVSIRKDAQESIRLIKLFFHPARNIFAGAYLPFVHQRHMASFDQVVADPMGPILIAARVADEDLHSDYPHSPHRRRSRSL